MLKKPVVRVAIFHKGKSVVMNVEMFPKRSNAGKYLITLS